MYRQYPITWYEYIRACDVVCCVCWRREEGEGRREKETRGHSRKAAGGRREEAEGGGETEDGRYWRLLTMSSGSVGGMSIECQWNVMGSLDEY